MKLANSKRSKNKSNCFFRPVFPSFACCPSMSCFHCDLITFLLLFLLNCHICYVLQQGEKRSQKHTLANQHTFFFLILNLYLLFYPYLCYWTLCHSLLQHVVCSHHLVAYFNLLYITTL